MKQVVARFHKELHVYSQPNWATVSKYVLGLQDSVRFLVDRCELAGAGKSLTAMKL